MAITNYIWDVENDSYLMETDGAGATTVVYTNEPVQYGRAVSQRRGQTTSCSHFDGTGSTRELTGAAEAATAGFDYSAFGMELNATSDAEGRFRYGGEHGYYHDAELGTLYVRARRYAPVIGRWRSLDPERILDQYVYCSNAPPSCIDPSGFTTISTGSSLRCPRPCKSECKFTIAVMKECPPKGRPKRRAVFRVRLSFSPTPPSSLEDLELIGGTPCKCYGGFNRSTGDSSISWTLPTGEVCKVTSDNFPRFRSWPVRGLSPACDASIDFEERSGTGDYIFTGAESVSLSFCITTECFCGIGDLDIGGGIPPIGGSIGKPEYGTLCAGMGIASSKC